MILISMTDQWVHTIFPSCVSRRGYGMGPVCVLVCVSVFERSYGWTVWSKGPKFGGGIKLDLRVKVKGQCHQIEKCDFWSFWWGKSLYILSWRYLTSQCHVTSCHDILMCCRKLHESQEHSVQLYIWFWYARTKRKMSFSMVREKGKGKSAMRVCAGGLNNILENL